MRRVSAGILAACVAAAIGAAPASALDKVVTIGSDGPGPAAYDKVYVHQMGPRRPTASWS